MTRTKYIDWHVERALEAASDDGQRTHTARSYWAPVEYTREGEEIAEEAAEAAAKRWDAAEAFYVARLAEPFDPEQYNNAEERAFDELGASPLNEDDLGDHIYSARLAAGKVAA